MYRRGTLNRSFTLFTLLFFVLFLHVGAALDDQFLQWELEHLPDSLRGTDFLVRMGTSNSATGEPNIISTSVCIDDLRTVACSPSSFLLSSLRDHRYLHVQLVKKSTNAIVGTATIFTHRLRISDMFYFQATSTILLDSDLIPTRITIAPDRSFGGPDPPSALILTRGTRGDVQPFVAIGRQLATAYGWRITICTESHFQELVESDGLLEFRPSGGDTKNRLANSLVAKTFIPVTTNVVQAMILARIEQEFFDSEPVVFDVARYLSPRAIIYGLTMTTLATVISEALHIPLVGFILQPSILPSMPPIVNIPGVNDTVYDDDAIAFLRACTSQLSTIRTRRHLPVLNPRANPWQYLHLQKSPMIVPISRDAFGHVPSSWAPNIDVTTFVFFNPPSQLSPQLTSFLSIVSPTIVISFSSMPVSNHDVALIVLRILDQCRTRPKIIVVTGDSRPGKKISTMDQTRLDHYQHVKRLIYVDDVPFHVLFPRIDAAIIQGGLGTTAEAIRAGIPVIVTGTLLLDQRFWGYRVQELGIGPQMSHISKFKNICVDQVDSVLASTTYRDRARNLSKAIYGSGTDRDGVATNALALDRAMRQSLPARYIAVPETSISLHLLAAFGVDLITTSIIVITNMLH